MNNWCHNKQINNNKWNINPAHQYFFRASTCMLATACLKGKLQNWHSLYPYQKVTLDNYDHRTLLLIIGFPCIKILNTFSDILDVSLHSIHNLIIPVNYISLTSGKIDNCFFKRLIMVCMYSNAGTQLVGGLEQGFQMDLTWSLGSICCTGYLDEKSDCSYKTFLSPIHTKA